LLKTATTLRHGRAKGDRRRPGPDRPGVGAFPPCVLSRPLPIGRCAVLSKRTDCRGDCAIIAAAFFVASARSGIARGERQAHGHQQAAAGAVGQHNLAAVLGANLLSVQGPGPGDQLQAGPMVRFQGGRDQDNNDALDGLGNVDASVEVGGFLRYGIRGLTAEVAAFKDVADGHDGIQAELSLEYGFELAPRWQASVATSTTWVDDNYMQAFFGISPAQAQRSGLRRFDAEAGFKDVGLEIGVNYAFTAHWMIGARAGYAHLLGDAADSPIVADAGSEHQFSQRLLLGYRF
jgi:outer membrane scaffolding protein for murein synthesis (MipA/OmpV family)